MVIEDEIQSSSAVESKRSSSVGGGQSAKEVNRSQAIPIEAYAYSRWKNNFKQYKQQDELFRGPALNIIDDLSIYVGTTKADCIGEKQKYVPPNNDGEADPDAYEHIKGIVSNIL